MSEKNEVIVCHNCVAQLNNLVDQGLFKKEDLITLTNPARIISVNFPTFFDNGKEVLISGFRVQYNDALGPTKGGIRMHQESDVEEVSELAFLMSLKTSLLDLPYGGAKGAIKINPKNLSSDEKERVVRSFGKAISKFIGPDFDIPAPDVNTSAKEMSLIRDEYEKITGTNSPAVITGKHPDEGGSLGRDTSTALGGFFVLKEHFRENKGSVAIQGFGNVGSHIANFLNKDGFKVVAVSDSGTGIYSRDGLNIDDLIEFKKDGGKFSERPEKKIPNEELLELNVDVLIPSALGNVITQENVSKIKAKTILEMANAPINPNADKVLEKEGVTIIPDILSNAGGVVVSYFEWEQNRKNEIWSLEEVNSKLEGYMREAYRSVREKSQKEDINLRNSAFLISIKRILEAEKKRA